MYYSERWYRFQPMPLRVNPPNPRCRLIKIFAAVFENFHPLANGFQNFFRNLGHDQFFAIGRSSRQNNAVRVNDGGVSAKSDAIVCAYSIGQDQIGLIFHRPGQTKNSQMFNSREWPGRRIYQDVHVLIHRQFAGHFRKSQIVTNR